ncbi:MAG: transposase [Thermoguttaceae bacterium]|nr:transposase [Thermoguttaceae bacterium]
MGLCGSRAGTVRSRLEGSWIATRARRRKKGGPWVAGGQEAQRAQEASIGRCVGADFGGGGASGKHSPSGWGEVGFGAWTAPVPAATQDLGRRRLCWATDRMAEAGVWWVVEIVSSLAEAVGFELLPRRWVVERTFAWFSRYRRLSKHNELLRARSETMILVAMMHWMVRRLRACPAR